MPGIFSENNFYSFEELPFYQGEEKELLFCRSWLNGKKEFVLQTSGSTGPPRKIILKREQLEWSASATKKSLRLTEKNHLFLCLDISGIGGLMMLVRAMEWKCPLTLAKPLSDALQPLSENHSCNLLSLVPFQLATVLENPESLQKLDRFEKVILGGGPLGTDLEKKLKNRKALFFHSYGMTETCSHIALRSLSETKTGDFFRPLEGVQVSLAPDSCLQIKAPSALNGFVQTNDLAEILADGSFRILGRKDFAIISGGIKILPEQTEKQVALFCKKNNIRLRFFCYGLPDEKLGQKLVLFVEGAHDILLEKKMTVFLNSAAEKYKAPKAIIFVPAFRYTPTGKINRTATVKEHYGEK
jgi:O-succinylbenzoic acid--CoA ligase